MNIIQNILSPLLIPFYPIIIGIAPAAAGAASSAIPAVIASGTAITTKLFGRIGAKKRRKRAEKRLEAAANTFEVPDEAKAAVDVAAGVSNQGDPTAAAREQLIEENEAASLGTAASISGSTQELINNARKVSEGSTAAGIRSKAIEGEVGQRNRLQLAEALAQLGRQKQRTDALNQNQVNIEGQRLSGDAQARATSFNNFGSDISSAVILADEFGRRKRNSGS